MPQLAEQRVVAVVGEGDEPAVAAIALASAAAAVGRGAILVECDLARPRLAAQVGLAPSPGLHEYLRWEAEPAEVLQPLALAGPATAAAGQLVCVCGGRPAINAETLLGLQSFTHMAGKLRSAYQTVLLIAPPLLTEPGSCLAVASQADAAIAALPAPSPRSARAAIRRLPVPALGTVVVAA
jgi:Mrp family chromosome partitioning ATPase